MLARDQVIHDIIMRWLYTLHLRAPGATVLLVANKCDRAVKGAAETVRMVERRVIIMLQEWKDRRGLRQNSGMDGFDDRVFRHGNTSAEVNVLEGSSIISCDNYDGIPTLIERILAQCVSSIEVPPAWELALEVINALRCKRSPMRAAFDYIQLPVLVQNDDACWSRSFITKEELSSIWKSVVGKAKDEMLRTNRSGMSRLWQDVVRRVIEGISPTDNEAAVSNPDSALEGALQIRWVDNKQP